MEMDCFKNESKIDYSKFPSSGSGKVNCMHDNTGCHKNHVETVSMHCCHPFVQNPSFVLYCFVLLRIDLFCPAVIERPLLCFSSLSACSLSFSVRLLLECLIQMLFAFILVCAVHELLLGGFCVCVGSMCWSSGMCRRWTL